MGGREHTQLIGADMGPRLCTFVSFDFNLTVFFKSEFVRVFSHAVSGVFFQRLWGVHGIFWCACTRYNVHLSSFKRCYCTGPVKFRWWDLANSNGPVFTSNILRNSGIVGAADESVFNAVLKLNGKAQKIPFWNFVRSWCERIKIVCARVQRF